MGKVRRYGLFAVHFLSLGKDSQQSQLQSSVRDPLFFVFVGLWVVEEIRRSF